MKVGMVKARLKTIENSSCSRLAKEVETPSVCHHLGSHFVQQSGTAQIKSLVGITKTSFCRSIVDSAAHVAVRVVSVPTCPRRPQTSTGIVPVKLLPSRLSDTVVKNG